MTNATTYDVPVARPHKATDPETPFWQGGLRTREQVQTTGKGIVQLPAAPNWYSGERWTTEADEKWEVRLPAKNGEAPGEGKIRVLYATPEEGRWVRSILGLLPQAIIRATGVRRVVIDAQLGAAHGIALSGGEIRMHPKMFPGGVKTQLGHEVKWPHGYFTIIHELGHALDNRYQISGTPEWLALSDWRHEPQTMGKKSPAGRGRYVEKRPGWPAYTSPWTHDETERPFIRQYAHKGPPDDWADTWAYYWLSPKAFDSEKLRRKYEFIHEVVERICDGEPPVIVDIEEE